MRPASLLLFVLLAAGCQRGQQTGDTSKKLPRRAICSFRD